MLMSRLKNDSGFTIVELLVTIVVIAILASISVVAYGGITQRAKTNTVITHIRQWEKLFESYIVDNGKPPAANWRCLGDATTLPAKDGYAENFCFKPTNLVTGGGTGTTAPADPVLMQILMNANPGSRLPEANFPETTGNLRDSDEGLKIRVFRGVFYDGSTNNFADNPAILGYYISGSECPIGQRISWWTDGNATSACAFKLSVNEHGHARGSCNIAPTPSSPGYYGYSFLDSTSTSTRYCYQGQVVTF